MTNEQLMIVLIWFGLGLIGAIWRGYLNVKEGESIKFRSIVLIPVFMVIGPFMITFLIDEKYQVGKNLDKLMDKEIIKGRKNE